MSDGELKVGLIGGTGLGDALGATTSGRRRDVDTPFGRPSDAIVEGEWAGVPILVLARHGPGHVINPSQVNVRANIFALKQLGCTHILASGAVGSLREEFKPRHLVVPDQIIDKTARRPNTFYERAAVHVEFAEPFDPVLRRILLEAGEGFRVQGSGTAAEARPAPSSPSPEPRMGSREAGAPNPEPFTAHDRGCYVCMEGPAFSTRAESLMHRLWGGDLIGMTAMPEAKLAREAEIPYALVALVTDYDCWRQPPTVVPGQGGNTPQPPMHADPDALLKEILGNLRAATENAVRLLRRAVELMAEPGRRAELMASPARHALRLGIWSDKTRVPPDEVARLRPLWGRYFDEQPAPPVAAPAGGGTDVDDTAEGTEQTENTHVSS
jgi:5'-methylthioadenosine phosphorylase